MKYYIIAGEASGDLHGSNLVKALKAKDPNALFRGWGGDLMREEGVEIVKHIRELAFMGFKEVILNLRTIFRNIRLCKQDIQSWKPDVIVFIDYPGFNMRIAGWAKRSDFKTAYYISPQIWAWKPKRALKLKRYVGKMIVILPFEKAFYRKYDFDVFYAGHPLLDAIESAKKTVPVNYFPDFQKPLITLLPGSRKQEIRKMLPVMINVSEKFPDYQFVIGGAPALDESFYTEILESRSIPIVFGKTYELLSQSEAALVTSGTATLETALFEVPEVVCYKGSKLSYFIGKRLVNIKYISLVNLIMDKEVVKELIQDDFNINSVTEELTKILNDSLYREKMKAHFRELKEMLGGKGASARAADEIIKFTGYTN